MVRPDLKRYGIFCNIWLLCGYLKLVSGQPTVILQRLCNNHRMPLGYNSYIIALLLNRINQSNKRYLIELGIFLADLTNYHIFNFAIFHIKSN